jgi:hypothetical protein
MISDHSSVAYRKARWDDEQIEVYYTENIATTKPQETLTLIGAYFEFAVAYIL